MPQAAQDQDVPSATQFARPPRFSHGFNATQTQCAVSPTKPTLAETLRASLQRVEAVEDAGTSFEDNEMLLDQPAVDTTEVEAPTEEWGNDLPLSPKRRRTQYSDATSSHFIPASETQISRSTPTFTSSSHVPTSIDLRVNGPRAFVRAEQIAAGPTEPLPEAFSPHRRGQKFVVGAMAATVQQWVLEAGQAAIQSRKGKAYLRGEDYQMRAKIEGAVEGNGPFTATARLANGEPLRLLLAGRAHVDGLRDGCVLGIRAPMWEVELADETWTVGVDWWVL